VTLCIRAYISQENGTIAPKRRRILYNHRSEGLQWWIVNFDIGAGSGLKNRSQRPHQGHWPNNFREAKIPGHSCGSAHQVATLMSTFTTSTSVALCNSVFSFTSQRQPKAKLLVLGLPPGFLTLATDGSVGKFAGLRCDRGQPQRIETSR
jgi:hypothetical protein